MVDMTTVSPLQRSILHQIVSILPKMPSCLWLNFSRKVVILQSQRWYGDILEGSFRILMVINFPDLCESPLLEMNYGYDQDPSYQATPIATLECKVTNSSSDGSFDHNKNVPSTAHTTEPGELPLLDGIQPHHHSQSDSTRHSPYADALKFGVRDNDHSQVPTFEPKLCSQLLRGNPTGVLLIGQTSHSSDKPETDPPMPLYPHPSHMDELLACCLIGKI
ncbi:hypothetical protein Cgig2_026269 [Carnegiea gigantea]|uniref:Uncharacterized protein n=1 Tax=Carnegiea gigantea TaxID=171969 RepID=A0A9Q1Q709_9CARY|nr:hypothetical protein Cgig2_026269 [Carnegiea gigantea]